MLDTNLMTLKKHVAISLSEIISVKIFEELICLLFQLLTLYKLYLTFFSLSFVLRFGFKLAFWECCAKKSHIETVSLLPTSKYMDIVLVKTVSVIDCGSPHGFLERSKVINLSSSFARKLNCRSHKF